MYYVWKNLIILHLCLYPYNMKLYPTVFLAFKNNEANLYIMKFIISDD